MSEKVEVRDLQILTGVIAGRITTKDAAATLGLSSQHVRHPVRRFESESAAALVHSIAVGLLLTDYRRR